MGDANTKAVAVRRPAPRVLASIHDQPWAIREESLREIIAIAARANLGPEAVAAERGKPLTNAQSATRRGNVAVIPVLGPIFRYANLFTEISGATSLDVFARDFAESLANPEIAGIVLEIDSPGGQAAGIGEMADILYRARSVKPVVAYGSSYVASAAYYLGAAAGELIVAPSALVGSIGVIMTYVDTRKQDEMLGVEEIHIISSQSPHKWDDPKDAEARGRIQSEVDALADLFVRDVAKFRGVTKATVLDDFGRGGILIGSAAVEAGMVDRLGSFERTIRHVANGGARLRQQQREREREQEKEAPARAAAASGKVTITTPRKGAAMADESLNLKEWINRKLFGPATDQGEAAASHDTDSDTDDDFHLLGTPLEPMTSGVTTGGASMPAPAAPPSPSPPLLAGQRPDAEAIRLREELARERSLREQVEAERDRERAERDQADKDAQLTAIREKARAFAVAQVRAGHVVPARREALERQHGQAALDDLMYPVESGPSRVEVFEDLYADRDAPPSLTAERVSNLTELGHVGEDAAPDPEEQGRREYEARHAANGQSS